MTVCYQNSIVSKGITQTAGDMFGGYPTKATWQSDIGLVPVYTGQNSNQIVADTPLVVFL